VFSSLKYHRQIFSGVHMFFICILYDSASLDVHWYSLTSDTHLLTTFMEQSPSREVTCPSASHEITRLYGTRKSIIMLARARHWSLSWVRWIQSTPSHLISLRFILISSSHVHLGLRSGLFPFGFRIKNLYVFLASACQKLYCKHYIKIKHRHKLRLCTVCIVVKTGP
jgi:hypothetical protein